VEAAVDIRQLTYFLAVVDHGGFRRAAEQLHIAQPSLSQSMGLLERELGVALFHRVGRGVVLSDAGRELIEPARRVVRNLDAARSAVGSVMGVQQGTVHLSAMPSPGIEPLTTMLTRFRSRFPGIAVSVDGAFTPEDVIEAVRSGTAEIGVLGAATPPHLAGLDVLPLEDQPLVLISPPETDLPAGRDIALAGVPGLKLIASQRGSLMRQLVDDVLAEDVDAEIVVELAHRTSILPLVLAGVGHAVMPSSWTPLAERAGAQVHRIQPETYLRIALLSRSDDLTPAAQAFLRVARHHRPSADHATAAAPQDASDPQEASDLR